MFHVPKFLGMLLVMLSAITFDSQIHASDPKPDSNIFKTGPTYRYLLKEDKNLSVCKHMLTIFNDKFGRPWEAPPLTSVTNDPIYSADSKYAFSRFLGVNFDPKVTFDLRFLSQPTSTEFLKINWKQGLAIAGGCPPGKVCSGQTPQPILVAYFDFENNGTTDTVIILGAFPGYMDAVNPINEYVTVWRNQIIPIKGVVDLWKLAHPDDKNLTPLLIDGKYFRVFVYEGRTYIAKYMPQYAQYDTNPNAMPVWTWRPSREDMLVQQYSFTGQKNGDTGRAEWTIDTVCDFEMKSLN